MRLQLWCVRLLTVIGDVHYFHVNTGWRAPERGEGRIIFCNNNLIPDQITQHTAHLDIVLYATNRFCAIEKAEERVSRKTIDITVSRAREVMAKFPVFMVLPHKRYTNALLPLCYYTETFLPPSHTGRRN